MSLLLLWHSGSPADPHFNQNNGRVLAGFSVAQWVTITGTGFPTGALVLVTKPGCSTPIEVVPTSVTSTAITFQFVFDQEGDYSFVVTDPTGACDTCPSVPFLVTAEPLLCPDVAAFLTLGELLAETLHRLGDDDGAIWSADHVRGDLLEAYLQVTIKYHCFWTQTYAENLPAGFSVTQPWELLQLGNGGANFNYGVANFTAEFERRAGASIGFRERDRIGPANHTSPFEATDGLLSRAGASTAIPAVATLPKTLTKLDRVTWDNRGIDALQPRTHSKNDSRYEITAGEVYGYMWEKDGVRTLRKVRVPAAQAETEVINGSWGILRQTTDLSTTTPTGTWGIPRIIEGHHPIGPDLWGAPRRPYLDGLNVRVEHFRQGRLMDADNVVCELPPRYARYLRDYAQASCYNTPGPGYDKALADHFFARWARGLKRIERRLHTVDTEHVTVMGGTGEGLTKRPPRPHLPWAYGSTVR